MPVDTATTKDENMGSRPVNEFDPHWCHEPEEQSEPGDPQAPRIVATPSVSTQEKFFAQGSPTGWRYNWGIFRRMWVR